MTKVEKYAVNLYVGCMHVCKEAFFCSATEPYQLCRATGQAIKKVDAIAYVMELQ